MNSVLQLLWSVPQLETRYLTDFQTIFQTAPRVVPDDVLSQVGVTRQEGGVAPRVQTLETVVPWRYTMSLPTTGLCEMNRSTISS